MISHPRDPSRRRSAGQSPVDSKAQPRPDSRAGARPESGGDSREAVRAATRAAEAGERVARVLARAGVASRREAEKLIESGRVALNGQVLTSPAVNVGKRDILTIDGKVMADREPARLWLYHKPTGLMTTHKDPKGRPTVFDHLPKGLPRVISIGRLDINSEGLLLLTNDGDLARRFELPASGLVRRYRVRVFGRASQETLDTLKGGVTVDGVAYGPIQAHLDGGKGSNVWISITLAEGKNREVRRVLESLGLKVNRLIRTAYGPFDLGSLQPGEVEEVQSKVLRPLLKGEAEIEALAGDVLEKQKAPKRGVGRKPSGPVKPPRPQGRRMAAVEMPADPKRRRKAPSSGGGGTASGPGTGRPAAKAAKAEAKPPTAYKAGWARPKIKPKPAASAGKPRRRPGARDRQDP